MSGKNCPRCGHRISLRRFVRLTSNRFACERCGAELNADLGRSVLALLIMSGPIGYVGGRALHEPVWWFAVAGTMVLWFVVHHWLFRVRLARGASTSAQHG